MAKCKSHPLAEAKLGIDIRVHGLLLLLATFATTVACITSFYLVYRHASNYAVPKQQKQLSTRGAQVSCRDRFRLPDNRRIIRILLMVPIYSIACTLSIEFYTQHVYIAAIYEFYESLVIASFFQLLCQYLHPDISSQQRLFAGECVKKWIYPVRFVVVHVGRNKSGKTADGLRLFNIIWAAVYQFCFVKFFGALVKCITEAADVYCKESNHASHAKIWVMVVEMTSLVTAMMCLLQFYVQTQQPLQEYNVVLKFTAIKLVVFLFYVQTFIFGFLTREGGPVRPTAHISHPSWAVGIPNTILCFEMAAVSVLHLWAYPYAPYVSCKGREAGGESSQGLYRLGEGRDARSSPSSTGAVAAGSERCRRAGAWRAIGDALNFYDVAQAVGTGSRWIWLQARKR
ncbi:Transmembrane protein 184-like protein [Colletotrichum sidae]|uniref:Transmembrane protein 184-like protein n=1 Tax=Colletotrichum sidae TaxID=1347389 RepID=A0A4R8TNR5_9PEZI|nr:Transmembrane protein 184-like protein [Colletotrichum sidae]